LTSVLIYKAKNGRLPNTLAEAGVTELDPFDGKPLRYKAIGGGCKVYSIGVDKVDDGGLRVRKEGSSNMDIVVQFPYNMKSQSEK
jgi:hypothetical protein